MRKKSAKKVYAPYLRYICSTKNYFWTNNTSFVLSPYLCHTYFVSWCCSHSFLLAVLATFL